MRSNLLEPMEKSRFFQLVGDFEGLPSILLNPDLDLDLFLGLGLALGLGLGLLVLRGVCNLLQDLVLDLVLLATGVVPVEFPVQ